MSDHTLTLRIKIPEPMQDYWVALVQGMCNGELGAYFEERIAAFGPAAESAAEIMLDDWDDYTGQPSFSNFRMAGNSIRFDIFDGGAISERISSLKRVFEVCGVEEFGVQGELLEDE